jgi:hypothetical protein
MSTCGAHSEGLVHLEAQGACGNGERGGWRQATVVHMRRRRHVRGSGGGGQESGGGGQESSGACTRTTLRALQVLVV